MKHTLTLATCLAFTLLQSCATPPNQSPVGKQAQTNLNQLRLGMTQEQVIALVGRPVRVNKSLDAAGYTEEWIYTDSQFWNAGQAVAAGLAASAAGGPVHEGQLYLHFTSGKLTSIQTHS